MSNPLDLPAPSEGKDNLYIPHAERKTVETLLANDCRWPYGDPSAADFYFCGKQKKDGSPYCDFHVRRGFQATKSRPVYRPHGST